MIKELLSLTLLPLSIRHANAATRHWQACYAGCSHALDRILLQRTLYQRGQIVMQVDVKDGRVKELSAEVVRLGDDIAAQRSRCKDTEQLLGVERTRQVSIVFVFYDFDVNLLRFFISGLSVSMNLPASSTHQRQISCYIASCANCSLSFMQGRGLAVSAAAQETCCVLQEALRVEMRSVKEQLSDAKAQLGRALMAKAEVTATLNGAQQTSALELHLCCAYVLVISTVRSLNTKRCQAASQ